MCGVSIKVPRTVTMAASLPSKRAQVVWRNDGGAAGEIRPAGEREQRPDQPAAKFFEDEDEDEDEKAKRQKARRAAAEQTSASSKPMA